MLSNIRLQAHDIYAGRHTVYTLVHTCRHMGDDGQFVRKPANENTHFLLQCPYVPEIFKDINFCDTCEIGHDHKIIVHENVY